MVCSERDLALVKKCLKLDGPEKGASKALILKDLALRRQWSSLCDSISDTQKAIRQSCDILMRLFEQADLVVDETTKPKIRERNILLKGKANAPFVDVSKTACIEVGARVGILRSPTLIKTACNIFVSQMANGPALRKFWNRGSFSRTSEI